MSRTDLTEQQWLVLQQHLPSNPRRGHAWSDHRRVINGILWRLKTGAPWHDIPPRCGPWQTCYDRFVRWSRDGTWRRIDWDGAPLYVLRQDAPLRQRSPQASSPDRSRA